VPEPDTDEILRALLRVDPTFFRLYSEIRMLDAEAARAASVADQFDAIGARMAGSESPESAVAMIGSDTDELASLERDVATARAAARALSVQLDAMREAGATPAQLDPLEDDVRALSERAHELETRVRAARSALGTEASGPADGSIEALLSTDRSAALRFPPRVAALRARMITAAGDAAVRALEELRDRLGHGMRQARIGRIDAVMGSKRRIEIQIESLAAGRFPPELMDPLRIQGLLRDDEEYWPFEGEMWEDEYEEDDAEDLEAVDATEEDPLDDVSDDELDDEVLGPDETDDDTEGVLSE
jgi:hypothetical protein